VNALVVALVLSALGIDPAALARLQERAKATRSDALIVVKNGQVVVELMSVTKGIVSLAIGALIDDGKLAGVDAPLSTWFPEWKTGLKAKVTLRHLLSHTSGLDNSGGAPAINGQKDRLAFARALPVVVEPGKEWSYSNAGIELLAGVVRAAAGQPIDQYVKERLFAPLGIRDFDWSRDEAGNVTTYAELRMLPRDLVRVGQMMLDGGRTPGGKQLVSRAWIEQSTRAHKKGGSVGLGWFVSSVGLAGRQTAARRAALQVAFPVADKLAPLDGKAFDGMAAYALAAAPLLTAAEKEQLFTLMRTKPALRPLEWNEGTPIGFHHDGSLGQFLEVERDVGLVAVRMHLPDGELSEEAYAADEEKNGMQDFFTLVQALVPRAQK
jgi:CubicO group peptidase (beta-lactamase class C family)